VRIFYRAGALVLAIFLVLFAVSNRQRVIVEFWPLPFVADAPLYLLCFAGFLLGALVGACAAWVAGRHARRELRNHSRRIAALERELAATQSQLAGQPGRQGTAVPADRELS
jgi:uncharacterized integral membrane protein